MATIISISRPARAHRPHGRRVAVRLTKNIFVAGQKYDFFDVFAKVDTQQTFQMYVGPRFDTVNGVNWFGSTSSMHLLKSIQSSIVAKKAPQMGQFASLCTTQRMRS